jgi:hypothetical protein
MDFVAESRPEVPDPVGYYRIEFVASATPATNADAGAGDNQQVWNFT